MPLAKPCNRCGIVFQPSGRTNKQAVIIDDDKKLVCEDCASNNSSVSGVRE